MPNEIDWLRSIQARSEDVLTRLLPPADNRLADAMRYATLNGGKRLRAALVYATASDFAIPLEKVDAAAAALECVHAYSLVHDDLPAMDNDDLRRGKPSCHKAFDEATAILAGDALNTFAFELLTQAPLPSEIISAQVKTLAHAAGPYGMVLGQIYDIAATGAHVSFADLQRIHRHKTGALLKSAVILGALPAADYAANRETLIALGETIGIAYQIIDDILDATEDSATLGKTAGKDAAQEKSTYLSHLGLAGSRKAADEHYAQCLTLLDKLPRATPHLHNLLELIFSRHS